MKMNLGSPPQPTLAHIAVCPHPESETKLLGQTTMISGQRKGKDLTCSPPPPIVCAVLPVQRRLLPLLGFHGKTARREACECLPSTPPQNVPPPAERIFHHVAPDAVDATVPRPMCPSRNERRIGTQFWPHAKILALQSQSPSPPRRPQQSRLRFSEQETSISIVAFPSPLRSSLPSWPIQNSTSSGIPGRDLRSVCFLCTSYPISPIGMLGTPTKPYFACISKPRNPNCRPQNQSNSPSRRVLGTRCLCLCQNHLLGLNTWRKRQNT